MNRGARASWEMIHAERARTAEMLGAIDDDEWHAPTLCDRWTVEQVTAHLTAAASTGLWRWLGSMAAAGFNPARHNDRRLADHRGTTPRETLQNFRAAVAWRTAPTRALAAWLGEVIVHGQDIARPLEIDLVPNPVAVLEVAHFYAAQDFAVNSHTLVKGLTLQASDADFAVGNGPAVRGALLDLVMAMAGRVSACAALDGPGLVTLRERLAACR